MNLREKLEFLMSRDNITKKADLGAGTRYSVYHY